jgi:hypothetical protein
MLSIRNERVEGRIPVRYRFGVPAKFSWQGRTGSRLQGEGITRDISVCGAYILTSTTPPADVALRLEFFLTPPDPTGHSVTIASEGRVLRVEHSTDGKTQSGFAVVSERFQILVVETERT